MSNDGHRYNGKDFSHAGTRFNIVHLPGLTWISDQLRDANQMLELANGLSDLESQRYWEGYLSALSQVWCVETGQEV